MCALMHVFVLHTATSAELVLEHCHHKVFLMMSLMTLFNPCSI
uniref:Uncharacterized protein n=1 Tax=Arundo donax TaxID=35708 RepID=A0A0A9HIT6_ARUDO